MTETQKHISILFSEIEKAKTGMEWSMRAADTAMLTGIGTSFETSDHLKSIHDALKAQKHMLLLLSGIVEGQLEAAMELQGEHAKEKKRP